MGMKWASIASAEAQLERAVDHAAAAVRAQLGGSVPDLIVVFASTHHADQFDRLPDLIGAQFAGVGIIGCSAGGVIGGGKEIEQHPGLSITAAVLPGVALQPFHLETTALPAVGEPAAAWEEVIGVGAARAPHFLLIPDPFSFDAEALLRGLDRAYPGSQKVGGLASGGRQPGADALFLGKQVYRSGLVGLALTGDIRVDTIVAQGCRPIGQPMFITQCQGNILSELDGRPAAVVLQEVYERLDAADQELARHSLFVGIVMNANRQEYHHGDFLIRNLIGIDSARGALAVGALLSENSVVQFHLRDAKTSADDLAHLLASYQAAGHDAAPAGALLFSCLGRGVYLYGRPDHDTESFRRHLGEVPLGGFFCNGEIGPVHGTTFLHGYTSAFGLFRPR